MVRIVVIMLSAHIANHFSLAENAKIGKLGYAILVYYFLSLDKPEFTEYAKKLSKKTKRGKCFSIAWWIVMGKNVHSNVELQKMITFLRENCERNKWDLTEWLKTQSKVSNHLKTTKFLNRLILNLITVTKSLHCTTMITSSLWRMKKNEDITNITTVVIHYVLICHKNENKKIAQPYASFILRS